MDRHNPSQLTTALRWSSLAVLGYLVYLVVSPILAPLAWAAVLAVITYPVYAKLAARWGAARSAAVTTLGATIVIVAPGVVLTLAFVRETLDLAAGLQQAFADGHFVWIERAWFRIGQRLPAVAGVDPAAAAADAMRRMATTVLMAQSESIFRNAARFLVNLTLALFTTFFLLRDTRPIMNGIRRLLPMEDAARDKLLAQVRVLISAGVSSAVIVAGLQGLLGGLAFAVVGIGAPVFWGVVMGVFCLLPFGAWIVWLPASAMLAADGATTRAIVLAALGVGLVSMVDNVVRPMILSGRAQTNGLVILVSLIGGLSVFGLIGLVLGPILIVTALSLVKAYIDNDAA